MSNKSKWLDEFLRQNYYVTEENADSSIRDKMYAQIINALKLQELVKESTTQGNPPIIAGYLLQLVEESEK